MTAERTEVIVSADERVAFPLAVLAASLAQHESVRLSVLVDPATPAALVDEARVAAGVALEIDRVEVPRSSVAGAPARHLSTASYFLLVAPDLLDVSRVIYIDLDVLVREPLSELWRMDMRGEPLAAVQSPTIPYIGSKNGVQSWRERGLDPRLPYFNGGVLMMDLDAWRRDDLGGSVIDIARTGRERFVNQGALNAHFAGRWTRLPLRWNQHSTIYDEEAGYETIFDAAELEEARRDPAIVHFVGPTKPWHATSVHPHAEAWREVARRVGSPSWTPERESLRTIAKRRVAKAVIALREG